MAFRFGFYNSNLGDRLYPATDVSRIFDGIIEDGVYSNIGNMFATAPGTGMQVLVKPGRAWFDHTWNFNDAALPLVIERSDITLTRIDAVVLEVNATNTPEGRVNSIKIVKGLAATNPQKPNLINTADIHQHPLAYVTVPGAATSIAEGNIQNVVGTDECPFVTGVLRALSIQDLWTEWGGSFNAWFSNIQVQLAGDIAANFQRQINDVKADIDDKWNKTLSSATKALFGLPDTATPDDAFQAMLGWDTKFEVGDIRQSIRSSIGSNWSLCNGATFQESTYPKLAQLLPATFNKSASWSPNAKTPFSVVNTSSQEVFLAPNEFIGCQMCCTDTGALWTVYYSSSESKLKWAYSTNGGATWNKYNFTTGALAAKGGRPYMDFCGHKNAGYLIVTIDDTIYIYYKSNMTSSAAWVEYTPTFKQHATSPVSPFVGQATTFFCKNDRFFLGNASAVYWSTDPKTSFTQATPYRSGYSSKLKTYVEVFGDGTAAFAVTNSTSGGRSYLWYIDRDGTATEITYNGTCYVYRIYKDISANVLRIFFTGPADQYYNYDISAKTMTSVSSLARPTGVTAYKLCWSPIDSVYYMISSTTLVKASNWVGTTVVDSVTINSYSGSESCLILSSSGVLGGVIQQTSSSSEWYTRVLSNTLPNVADVSGMHHFIKVK